MNVTPYDSTYWNANLVASTMNTMGIATTANLTVATPVPPRRDEESPLVWLRRRVEEVRWQPERWDHT